MPKPLSSRGLFLTLLMLAAAWRLAVAAGDSLVTSERPAEYMVYQYPNTALVVRVDVPQAEFGARVYGPDNALLRAADVEGRRLGPVSLYIDSADLPRQLMIEVSPARPVARSAIALELIQFDAADRNDAALAGAYRRFSAGTETAHSDDTVTWASKVYSLRDAAAHFASLGREEMRLWSEFFAAHLVLHQLHDRVLALELAEEIRDAAARAGLEAPLLAARVLETEALMAQLTVAAEPDPRLYQRAHEALRATAELAGSEGLRSEQARALFHDGQVLEWQGEIQNALARYNAALDVLDGTLDDELLGEVRTVTAAAYERLGSPAGALEVLDTASAGGAGEDVEEQAVRLYERGRLLNLAYRHEEAADTLAQALELQQQGGTAASRRRTALELAWSLYSMGRNAEAVALLQENLPRVAAADEAASVARGWGSLADLYRADDSPQRAEEAREEQLAVLGAAGSGRAAASYAGAMDVWRGEGGATPRARQRLRDSVRLASEEGDELTAARASLQLCLAEPDDGAAAACTSRVAAALERLRFSGVPRLAVDGQLVWVRLLHRVGREGEAARAAAQLLDDVWWYRARLPGVLGAWYPENADAVADLYLRVTAGPGTTPARSLLALDRLRRFESPAAPEAAAAPLDSEREEALRGLLAQTELAQNPQLAAAAVQALSDARNACPGCGAPSSAAGDGDLEQWLQSLDPESAVLACYLGGEQAWLVIAGPRERRRLELGAAARLRDRLEGLNPGLAQRGPDGNRAELDALGRLLLGPLENGLPRRIYFLSSGPLRAIPLDSLRLGGRYLAERSRVVNLDTLEGLGRSAGAVPDDYRERVFLAGNPQSQRDPFRFDMVTSPEIEAVTDRFVGSGLHVVQGMALGPDEFDDPRFARAALLHLAIPGVIDLDQPRRSRLLLASNPEAGLAQRGLAPDDLRAYRLDASLVVLSATAVSGEGSHPASGYLPLASDLIEAGAGAVVYSLWPVGEASAAAFARRFYESLESGPDIVSAFFAARSAGFPGAQPPEFENWSGFQLLIR